MDNDNDTNSVIARFLHKFAFRTEESNEITEYDAEPETPEKEIYPIQRDEDELWAVAQYAVEIGTVSISRIQRKFRFGFNRAANTLDNLVEAGILIRSDIGQYNSIVSGEDLPEKLNTYNKRSKITNLDSFSSEELVENGHSEIEQLIHVLQENITYHKPPTYLLNNYIVDATDLQTQKEDGHKLVECMASFGIKSTLVDMKATSVCTIYSIAPESGTKVSKIKGIKPDLELNLGKQVEIEIGSIPGALNFRIPTPDRGIVGLKQLINNPDFTSDRFVIPIAAGIDDMGNALFIDITKTPHLLIAGTTGSGKSVFISDIVISVLFACDPNEVKMLLIDPKAVELSRYNSIPHLIQPVVTDSNDALDVLSVAEKTMKDRYHLFAEYSAKNIDDYNKKVPDRRLPRILIIIDEYAELMYEAPKELEQIICSLARMSRAAGMYLILATQRPNSEVITANIRANIPARIAFSVINWRESHTILNASGAEKLLGNGDMLYAASDAIKIVHAQAAFVSDEEIDRVLKYINSSEEDDGYHTKIY